MRVPFVDLKRQYEAIRNEVQDALSEALDSMDLVLGPNVRAFEAEFAAYCRARFAVGVGSGTDALYLALRACGVRPGDEVITVAHTFVGTMEAFALLGAVPVFVDVDPQTYTLSPERLEAAISPRTRAVVPVHLYGHMADMRPIMDIARRHGLAVVEDACHAPGGRDGGMRAGSVGDAAAFSFSVCKSLGAYGEAGAVTTNSRAVAEQVRLLRDHGNGKQQYVELGINARLDELQAAVLRVKLRHLDIWNEARRAHAESYARLLADLDAVLPVVRRDVTHVYQLYVIQVDNRNRIRQELADRGVAAGVHYPAPLHLLPAAREIARVAGDLSVTEYLARRVLSLPMYAELDEAQLNYVAACLHACVAERSELHMAR